jgi:hypothetical protein
MNRNNLLATATLAATFALGWSPALRAENQPSADNAGQPPAAQPAANSQPTADQRLQALEREVIALQQQIAALKAENTPSVETVALLQPDPNAAPAAFGPAGAGPGDEAPKINLAGLLGGVTLSGFGDVYYSYNANHPFNNESGLRFFEAPTNGFAFNMAELILDKTPEASTMESRLGYHVAAGYGQAAKVVNGSDNTGFGDGSNFFLKEAYMSYLAPVGKGLTVTVGKFVTNAGAEVIETAPNWNYSHSLLFYYAIPFFHFGAKAAYTFSPKWSANLSLMNGWNNTIINHNAVLDTGVIGASSGLTYGATVAFTPNSKWSAYENYYVGPVTLGFKASGATDNSWKHLSDTVIGFTPNSKWAFQINGDYGLVNTSRSTIWWGLAGYGRYTFSPKTNFAVRYEYIGDPDGFLGLLLDPFGGFSTGHAQEVTGTLSHNFTSNLLTRLEYRYDFASSPIFAQSFSSSVPGALVKEQSTVYLGFIYSFSSANMK